MAFLDDAEKTLANILSGGASYEDLAKATIALEGFEKTFGTVSSKIQKNAQSLRQSLSKIYTFSNTEMSAVKVFENIMTLNVGGAVEVVTEQFKAAVVQAQVFHKELIQYGQDLSYQKAIAEQAKSLASLGISYEDLKSSNKALFESYNASIRATEKQSLNFESNRTEMSKLIAVNEKFGISSKTTADLLNFTKNTLGGGTEAAMKFSDQMLKFADDTGQKAEKVFGNFNDGLDRFSILTADRAVLSFQKLEMAAARTGQSMWQVFDTVSKFDDIEEGFSTGGQLNRVLSFLGGSFDTFKAMQATDEERAKMIYESISSVGNQFQAMQTEQAKRSFAKQLAESTGVDLKTVVGLLNKSTNLSEDMSDIFKKPITTEGMTTAQKDAKLIGLSTSEDFAKVRDSLLEATSAVQTFSQNVKKSDVSRTASFVSLVDIINDKMLSPIVEANVGSIKTAMSDLKKEFQSALNEPAKAYQAGTTNFLNGVNKFVAIIGNPKLGTTATKTEVKPSVLTPNT